MGQDQPRLRKNHIYQGDALQTIKTLPDSCIDLLITSPPYWGLRDYGSPVKSEFGGKYSCEHDWVPEKQLQTRLGKGGYDDTMNPSAKTPKPEGSQVCLTCGAWKGQLGHESHYDQFVEHLTMIFDEMKRVLKDTGTMYVNLGDTYSGGVNDNDPMKKRKNSEKVTPTRIKSDLPPKSLTLVPMRFAIRMVEKGWILRNVIVWHKPSCMPQSVRDRYTVDWEYMFFFAKKKKYYFERQMEPFSNEELKHIKTLMGNYWNEVPPEEIQKGRNKRSVWTIGIKPYSGAHFAVYPPELLEVPIKASCPDQVCVKCGKPRQRKYRIEREHCSFDSKSSDLDRESEATKQTGFTRSLGAVFGSSVNSKRVFDGWEQCGCGEGFEPGIVLDPFMGSGTTGLVAKKLGRDYVGIELNPEYIKLADKRIGDWAIQEQLTRWES